MEMDEFAPTETSYIVIRYNQNATQTKYREKRAAFSIFRENEILYFTKGGDITKCPALPPNIASYLIIDTREIASLEGIDSGGNAGQTCTNVRSQDMSICTQEERGVPRRETLREHILRWRHQEIPPPGPRQPHVRRIQHQRPEGAKGFWHHTHRIPVCGELPHYPELQGNHAKSKARCKTHYYRDSIQFKKYFRRVRQDAPMHH